MGGLREILGVLWASVGQVWGMCLGGVGEDFERCLDSFREGC